MKKLVFVLFYLYCISADSQITVDRTSPNNNPTYLIDNVLLGGGIVASNHNYEGDSCQIGFFNAVNTNLEIFNECFVPI